MLQRSELKVLLIIASLFFCRIWGIFLLLPVLPSLLATYPGADAHLAGLAVGAYGLCQALMQLPLSLWSDRIGRKPVIVSGFVLLALGSVVAGISDNVYLVIFGRCLQGAGAIGACLMAMVGDYLGLGKRAVGMAVIGMAIGGAFLTAVLLGPFLVDHLGLGGLFNFIAGLAGLGIVMTLVALPKPKHQLALVSGSWRSALGQVLRRPVLMSFNVSVLVSHAVLAGLFFVIDLFNPAWPRMPFVIALIIGFLAVLPMMRRFDRAQSGQPGLLAGFLLMVMGLGLLGVYLWLLPGGVHPGSALHVAVGLDRLRLGCYVGALALFFAGFSLLEALLPSAVARFAPLGRRGASMGVFAMFQFFGVFIGAVCAGWLSAEFSRFTVLASLIGWSMVGLLLWLKPWFAMTQDHFELQLQVGVMVWADLQTKIEQIPGVLEVKTDASQHILAIAYKKSSFSYENLLNMCRICNVEIVESTYVQRS